MATQAQQLAMTKLIADNTGWRGNDLITAVAIALRESDMNPNAYNGNRRTGDNSYGLFQLNTLGNLWGIYQGMGFTDRNQLLDPAANARAAYALFQRNGNTFRPWLGYRAGLTVANQLPTAKGLVQQAQTSGLLNGRVGTVGKSLPLSSTKRAVDTGPGPYGSGVTPSLYPPEISATATAKTPTTATTTAADFAKAGYQNGYIPSDALESVGQGSHMLAPPAAEAYKAMVAAARADGVRLTITDSYRSYDQQVDLVKRKGSYSQGGIAATPGTSDHGWGLAVDVNTSNQVVMLWIRKNAARFGFQQDTPREPWHLGYHGPDADLIRGKTGTGSAATDAAVREVAGSWSGYIDDPVVGPILRQAAAEHWDAARLQAALEPTDWWRTTQDSIRNWDSSANSDPATAEAKIQAKMAELQTTASNNGYVISPDDLHDMARDSLRLGWSATQELNAIGAEAGKNNTLSSSTIMQSVRSAAEQMAVPLSEDAMRKWATDIATGASTNEAYREYLLGVAKGAYPALAGQLDQGATVKQLADPYLNLASTTLNVPLTQISLMDPKWILPLQGATDAKGQVRPMTMDEWGKKLKVDPTYGWQNTADARAQAFSFGAQLGQAFGMYAPTPAMGTSRPF